jgi:hypothetical protein
MSGSTQKRSGDQPWLGLRLFVLGALILMATGIDDNEQTLARYLVILLWILTAFVAMLKEALTYGLGDRVTLFGMLLTTAVSLTVGVLDNHPYSFVSLFTIIAALIMLRQTYNNVRTRQAEAAQWSQD